MRCRRKTASFLFVIAVGACGSVRAGDVIAVVNGQQITRQRFAGSLVETFGRAAIGSLIDQELIEQEAERLGIGAAEEEAVKYRALLVTLAVRERMDALRVGPDEFEELTRKEGWSLDDVRREADRLLSDVEVRTTLLAQKLIEKDLDLSEETLRRRFAASRGRRYSAAHIEVKSRSKAERLIDLLRKDASQWVPAALGISLDRESAPHKGRLPLVPDDSALGRALRGMRPGEMKLWEHQGRWHVLMFVSTVPATGESFDDVRPELRAEAAALGTRSRMGSLLAQLNARAHVVVNLSQDPEERNVLGEDVAAYVNGRAIGVGRLGEALLDQYAWLLLDRFIERELIFQEAARRNVAVTEEEVDARMGQIGRQLAQQRPRAQALSGAAGAPDDEKEAERLARAAAAFDDVRATLLAEKLVADQIEITPEEVDAVARELAGERLVVREIAAPSAASARRIRDALLNGASFDLLARMSSVQPAMWCRQGVVHTITAAHPYYARIQDLEEGGISRVLEDAGEFRIIKLVRRDPPAAASVGSLRDAARSEAVTRKARERIAQLLSRLKAEASIEKKSD